MLAAALEAEVTAYLAELADERDANGRRPALGSNLRFQRDGAWRDALLFYEYFHGDTGEGLGASHQTGWTALAGVLVANRRSRGETGCVIGEHG